MASVSDREGLGDARHALEEHVAAGEQADQHPLDQPVLADDHPLDLEQRALQAGRVDRRRGGLIGDGRAAGSGHAGQCPTPACAGHRRAAQFEKVALRPQWRGEPAHGTHRLLASSRVGQLPPWLPDALLLPGDVSRGPPSLVQPVGRTAP